MSRRSPGPALGYTGCCPREQRRGYQLLIGGIDRKGHGRIRGLLVEAVWRFRKWQPQQRATAQPRSMFASLPPRPDFMSHMRHKIGTREIGHLGWANSLSALKGKPVMVGSTVFHFHCQRRGDPGLA